MILRILSYDSNDELDKKYNGEDGEKVLDKPYCSKICKETEKIHLSLLQFLQKDDYIEQISIVEGQFSSIASDDYFSKSVACRKILELFTSPTYKIIEFIETLTFRIAGKLMSTSWRNSIKIRNMTDF